MAIARQTAVGRWIVVNHNTLRLCKHSLNFSQCYFCIDESAIGDEKGREKLTYVCIHGILPALWFIHIFGVWWWFFLASRKPV